MRAFWKPGFSHRLQDCWHTAPLRHHVRSISRLLLNEGTEVRPAILEILKEAIRKR